MVAGFCTNSELSVKVLKKADWIIWYKSTCYTVLKTEYLRVCYAVEGFLGEEWYENTTNIH